MSPHSERKRAVGEAGGPLRRAPSLSHRPREPYISFGVLSYIGENHRCIKAQP